MAKSKLEREEFWTLHRHWMWANVIKKNFEAEILIARKMGVTDPVRLLADRYGAYMSIWYGMLFGVLEVLRKEEISIPEFQAEADSIFQALRRFRNAIFHPQSKYFPPKLLEIMKDRDSVKKIWKVHSELGKWFLLESRELNAGRPGMYVH